MTQLERRSKIIELINRDRIVKVAELVDHFAVSMETIRRDLEELERTGNLRRVYGGAVLGTIYGAEPSYNNRQITHSINKKAIAKAVYDLIDTGDALFLDGGTTLVEVAKCIANGNKRGITIITNAINVACEAIKNEDCNVIVLGGSMTRGEPLLTGAICNSNLKYFYVNKIIMGVAGVSPEYGITDYSVDTGSLKRDMLSRTQEIICAADFSKFGVVATNCICPIESVHTLVTDWMTSSSSISLCEKAGTRVIVSPNPEG